LTTFSARSHVTETGSDGRSRQIVSTDVVGILRPDVASVAARWTVHGQEIVQFLAPLTAPGARVFGSSFSGSSVSLIARGRSGKVEARLVLRGATNF
jgi:hypothetical protein